jgi:hypothetical protein
MQTDNDSITRTPVSSRSNQQIVNMSGYDIDSELLTPNLFPKGTVIYDGKTCHEEPDKCFKTITTKYKEVFDNVAIIVYKKTEHFLGDGINYCLTKLLIPPKSRVHVGRHYQNSPENRNPKVKLSAPELKCRTDRAFVLENQCRTNPHDWPERIYYTDTTRSNHDNSFLYKKGTLVRPDNFETRDCYTFPSLPRCNEPSSADTCARGVHFFLTIKSANEYTL